MFPSHGIGEELLIELLWPNSASITQSRSVWPNESENGFLGGQVTYSTHAATQGYTTLTVTQNKY